MTPVPPNRTNRVRCDICPVLANGAWCFLAVARPWLAPRIICLPAYRVIEDRLHRDRIIDYRVIEEIDIIVDVSFEPRHLRFLGLFPRAVAHLRPKRAQVADATVPENWGNFLTTIGGLLKIEESPQIYLIRFSL